jgi:hypothetical protein
MKLVNLTIEKDWLGKFSEDRNKFVCKVTYENKESSFSTLIHDSSSLDKILLAISDVINQSCLAAAKEFSENILSKVGDQINHD